MRLIAALVVTSGCAVEESSPPSKIATALTAKDSLSTQCICPVAFTQRAQDQPISTECLLDCATCGNGVCDGNETRLSCPSDCTLLCGNDVCELGESSASCPEDCGPPPTPCGVGVCKNAFSVTSAQAQARYAWGAYCRAHPGTSAGGTLRPGTNYLTDQAVSDYAASPSLEPFLFPIYFDFVGFATWNIPDGAGTNCSLLPTSAINTTLCIAGCYPTPVCGNGVCETGESSSTCSTDCAPVCGNGLCETGESPTTCSIDCGPPPPVCGNRICEDQESIACPGDCNIACMTFPCNVVQ